MLGGIKQPGQCTGNNVARRSSGRVTDWREVPHTPPAAMMVKIADTPCQLVYFELYSNEPYEILADFVYGF